MQDYRNNSLKFSAIFAASLTGFALLASCSARAEFQTGTGFEQDAQTLVSFQLSPRDAATANYLTACDLTESGANYRKARAALCAVRVYDGHQGAAGDWQAYRTTYRLECLEGASCAVTGVL
ncbi:MAG: hypothetical protein KDI44_06120 [Thiothrix sp.]|nr:hypothetical protein [Thiothrix sp.]HPQ95193.1 hypothetical protein [Thiolinea sp.]